MPTHSILWISLIFAASYGTDLEFTPVRIENHAITHVLEGV